MIEEGKLFKMIHSVLHDSLLETTAGNSATSSDNSTAIGRTTTDSVDTTSTETTTGNQKQSKHSSESQSQGVIKRQRTYEPQAGEEEKNVRVTAEFWAVMRTTHGFQGQAAAANDVAPNTEPGTSSRQQAEAFLERQRNPKRRRGSDGKCAEPTTAAATLKDASTSRPDTTGPGCIQVELGRQTGGIDTPAENDYATTFRRREYLAPPPFLVVFGLRPKKEKNIY